MQLKIDPHTDVYLSVSLRPGTFGSTVYNHLFSKRGLNAIYLPRSAPAQAQDLISAIRSLRIRGCSVSMPLKTAVIPLLDEVDFVANESLSVNTIVRKNDQLFGYNSDQFGILSCLKAMPLQSVLIYGTGSVVGSFASALQKLNLNRLSVFGRRPEAVGSRITEIQRQFPLLKVSRHEKNSDESFDLLINATPADYANCEDLKILARKARAIFDTSVNPRPSALIEAGRSMNVPTISGIDMCRFQIQKQFNYYTQLTASMEEIDDALSEYFARPSN